MSLLTLIFKHAAKLTYSLLQCQLLFLILLDRSQQLRGHVLLPHLPPSADFAKKLRDSLLPLLELFAQLAQAASQLHGAVLQLLELLAQALLHLPLALSAAVPD